MIARSRRLLRHVLAEYVEAFAAFSHNAKAFLAGLALQNAAFGMLLTVFGIYVKAAGLSEATLGRVEGTVLLAAAGVCVLAPPLLATFGYRRLLLVGAVAYAVARLLMGLVPSPAPLLAFALLCGVGEGFMQCAPPAFLSENSTPSERTHLYTADLLVRFSAAFAGSVAAGLLPVALAPWLPQVAALRVAVIGAAVLYAASLLPFARIREQVGHPRHAFREYVETMRGFRSWGHLARLMVPQFAIALGAGMIMPFLSLYLRHELGAGMGQVGLIQGVSQVAMGVAALAAPLLARRAGLIRGTVITQALSIPFLALIPAVGSLPLAAALFWTRGALMNMSWPLFNQFSMEGVRSAEKPAVGAGLALAYSGGYFGGSVLGGQLMLASYTLPYLCTAALYALGVGLTWWLLVERDIRPAVQQAEEPKLAS